MGWIILRIAVDVVGVPVAAPVVVSVVAAVVV